MKVFTCFMLTLMLVTMFVVQAYGDLEPLDPAVRDKQLAQAEERYAKQDVDGLLKLLKESHLFVKQDVALKLGRLGADKALPILRKYDRSYSRFECAPSGQFGVAVILIGNKTEDAQEKALLAVATESQKKGKHPHSVIDAAGRELSRFDGDDTIDALTDVYTYGAQFTVLALQCRKLSETDATAKCIAVLEAHETPLKAGAAEDILVSFGKKVETQVKELALRVEKKIKPTDPTFTIPKTIVRRCKRIVEQIEAKEKAITSNVAKPDISNEAVQEGLTQEQAVSIATKHIGQQKWKDKYDSTKPVRVSEAPQYWNVFFRRINFSGKPSQGLVRVYKETKEPKWVPLK